MNRLVSAVLDVFSSNSIVEPTSPPEAGNARVAAIGLITKIRESKPDEIRRESTPKYLEAVIRRDRLEEYSQMLDEALGAARKPFGSRGNVASAFANAVNSLGGIRKNQCLYLREFEDKCVIFAAVWPWADPALLTVKLGVFTGPADGETDYKVDR